MSNFWGAYHFSRLFLFKEYILIKFVGNGLCAVPLFLARHVGRALQYRLRITTQIPSQLRGDFYIKQAGVMQGSRFKGNSVPPPRTACVFCGASTVILCITLEICLCCSAPKNALFGLKYGKKPNFAALFLQKTKIKKVLPSYTL